MTTDTSAVTGEPEPIEADFEPAGGPKKRQRGTPPPRRSRSVSYRDLVIASSVAASAGAGLGAVIAIVAGSSSSGGSTGTLAREIDLIRSQQTQLSARADQVGGDIVTLRSRLDTQSDRLAQRDQGETDIRTELAAVTAQISALIGAGDGKAPAAATASGSPLGAVLARLNRLESVLAEDSTSPKTNRQMQRAVADLSAQVTALADAQTQSVAATARRQQAMDALTASVDRLTADVTGLRAEINQTATTKAVARKAPRTPFAAGSPTLDAFTALETAAQQSGGFLAQQQALASLLPADEDVVALADLASDGARSVEDLRREFGPTARAAERFAAPLQDDGWNWLRSAVTTVAPHEGETWEETSALIQEARRSLDMEDVRGAIEAIDDMKGPAAAAFRPWREAATRRADIDKRLEALTARLTPAPGRAG